MKKVLALVSMTFVVQGSLLLGNDLLYKYYIEERNLLGGHDNLETYLKDAELTRECLAISRPWNVLHNALTINDSSDFVACYALNKEFARFQQKFLKEVRDKSVINNNIFYVQYFAKNYADHEEMVSSVFYREPRKFDRKVTGEVLAYQNALRRSAEDLVSALNAIKK